MNCLYNDIMWNGFPVKNNHDKKCIDEYENLVVVNPNFVSTNRRDINKMKKKKKHILFSIGQVICT